MIRDRLKAIALKHPTMLEAYRKTFGRIKTEWYFGLQKNALQKRGPAIVWSICEALDKTGARYFLDCGTLLGFVRDKGPVANDLDIDFGIYLDESFDKESLDNVMLSIGMKPRRAFYYKDMPVEISYSNGILNIDFFRHFDSNDTTSVYSFHRLPDRKYPSSKHYTAYISHWVPIESIDYVDVGGHLLPIPSNYDAYIASHYGTDWRTPNPDWKYWMDYGLQELPGELGILK